MASVRKAVIAAAGLGTRFLPQTKAMPKEMLPIIDKPVIQYIAEELIEAGIEDIVIVTGYHKRAIEDHFDAPSQELVSALSQNDSQTAMLREVEEIASLANFAYIRQKGPVGNGTPLLNAEHLIGDEPFIYTFGDDFIKARPGRFAQMVEVHERTGFAVLSCIRAAQDEDYERYGFVEGVAAADGSVKISSIVEKPGKDHAPSDLASVSSYLLLPSVFKSLAKVRDGLEADQEVSLQRALQALIDEGETLLAHEVQNARYYDSGNKLEYLKTIIDIGADHPVIGPALLDYLRETLDARS